jgi:hypothetical protein
MLCARRASTELLVVQLVARGLGDRLGGRRRQDELLAERLGIAILELDEAVSKVGHDGVAAIEDGMAGSAASFEEFRARMTSSPWIEKREIAAANSDRLELQERAVDGQVARRRPASLVKKARRRQMTASTDCGSVQTVRAGSV